MYSIVHCPKCSTCDCRQYKFSNFFPCRRNTQPHLQQYNSYENKLAYYQSYCTMVPNPKSGHQSKQQLLLEEQQQLQQQQKGCGIPPSRKYVLCNRNEDPNSNEKLRRKSVPQQPFRQYCGEAPKLFTAPPIIQSKTKPITTAVRNYDTAPIRNFVAVPQAVELYDENPLDIRISRLEFEKLVAQAYKTTLNEVREEFGRKGNRKCTELDQPKFNSIKNSVKEIQFAIGNLQRIPAEIQNCVENDPVFQQRIKEAVTKKTNIPRQSRLYQELISIEAPEAERQRSAEEILKGIKSLHTPPKPKDPEPNVLKFNKPTFSRIKPKLPDPPPKPSKGASVNLPEDYQLILSEHEFSEKDSNASVFQHSFQD